MSVLSVVKVKDGRLMEAAVVVAQLEAVGTTLRRIPGALEESAVDLVPSLQGAEMEERREGEARAEVESAERALDAFPSQGLSTRSGKEDAGASAEALLGAKARLAAAVGVWEVKADRLILARKAVEVRIDKELREVKELVQQVALAFPPPVLAVLLPGARSVGLRADRTVLRHSLVEIKIEKESSGNAKFDTLRY